MSLILLESVAARGGCITVEVDDVGRHVAAKHPKSTRCCLQCAGHGGNSEFDRPSARLALNFRRQQVLQVRSTSRGRSRGSLELHHTSGVRIAPENALSINCAIDDEKPTYGDGFLEVGKIIRTITCGVAGFSLSVISAASA
jgi:hypothetical protein